MAGTNERKRLPVIANILAERYASEEMGRLFDLTNRVRLERELWLAVLEAQTALGLPLADGVLDDYRAAIDHIDLDSITARELETRHDVKARLDEFNAVAGHQELHKGLTSRDATENVEQLVVARALGLVEERTVALLARLAEQAAAHATMAIVGRTHNVPAQPTTMGKRFAQIGEELLAAFHHLQDVRARFALRGIKGPVGSQHDQLDLLGDPEKVDELERRLAAHLGFDAVLDNVGQVYPRSLDFAVVSTLAQLGSAPANLALAVRLMAGQELATEGFRPGQVGSSAMPHKMNTRSCERANGLYTILRGHVTMASGLAGDQWNEGDVSCSVVRRVVLPDAFFALDGLYETIFAVIRDFGVFPGVVQAELSRYLPFLSTTALLMHAVREGRGREEAHEIIKEHAVAAALRMREGKGGGRFLLESLAGDERFPGDLATLVAISDGAATNLGLIERQVGSFCDVVAKITAGRPEAAYGGADIL